MRNFLFSSLFILFILSALTPLEANQSYTLTASWYSIQSLRQEGTYKYSKGVMANGENFSDNSFTCATRLYPLGSVLRVTSVESGKSVVVKATDRIGKRFAKSRIDLSKLAFSRLSKLEKGIISVNVEVLHE
jgi:rare lipoprotein A